MNLQDVDRLVLFGGARIMAECAPRMKAKGWTVTVFSSSRHLDESVDSRGTTLAAVLKKAGVEVFSSDDINSDSRLPARVTATTLGLAFGAAWTFEKRIVDMFRGRLLDFMGIKLPQYRGGAHYTWQILAGNRLGSCNLQVILGGEETFHRGPILRTESYRFPAGCRIPLDYFDAAVPREARFIERFLDDARRGKRFRPMPLDESKSSYYPFLHTKTQGLIDWSWSVERVERFVCAFDEPYAGASTFVDGRRLFLKGASRDRSSERFHPFHAGLIYRLDERGAFVAAEGGGLLVRSIADESGRSALPDLRLGQRLRTPRANLEAALDYHAEYGAAGIKK